MSIAINEPERRDQAELLHVHCGGFGGYTGCTSTAEGTRAELLGGGWVEGCRSWVCGFCVQRMGEWEEGVEILWPRYERAIAVLWEEIQAAPRHGGATPLLDAVLAGREP